MPPGTYEQTYKNFRDLCADLEAAGIPGFQVLDCEGLAARTLAGDRRRTNIEGSRIIIPMNWNYYGPTYNTDTMRFGINLNGEGEDTEDWFQFDLAQARYQNIVLEIREVVFHRLTIRNLTGVTAGLIRLYVFQDPFFINQVNQRLKDITQ